MNWLLIAFLAPLLWAVSTFIDKVLLSKYFKGKVGALIIYSCLIGLPIFIIIFLFKPEVININLVTALLVILNSTLFIIYLFPYLYALNQDDTSAVVPIFRIVPVFTFILAFFILGEKLTLLQILAGILIISGAIGMSSNFSGKGIHIKKKVLGLMILASLMVAVNSVLFKFFAIELDFWTVSFWQYFGFFIFGLILLIFVKKYRVDFIESYRENKLSIVGLNLFNEVINIIAIIISTYATLLAPVALVGLVNGFQPFFVFLLGTLMTLMVPNLIKEDLSRKKLIQKIFFIIILFIGGALLV